MLGASVSYLGVSSAETSNEINAIVPSKFVALDIFVFHFFLRVAILEKWLFFITKHETLWNFGLTFFIMVKLIRLDMGVILP